MNQNYNQLQEVNYAVCNNSEESVWILAIFTAGVCIQYLSMTFFSRMVQSVFPTDKRLSAGSSRVVTFDQSSGLTGPRGSRHRTAAYGAAAFAACIWALVSCAICSKYWHSLSYSKNTWQYFQISREAVVSVIIGTYTGHHLYYSKIIKLFE